MKALTVEEYDFLGNDDGPDIDFPDEMCERLSGWGLVALDSVETEGEDETRYWDNTPHGDRAVRVHRAWLASMGVKA